MNKKKKFNVQQWMQTPADTQPQHTQTVLSNDKYDEVIQLIEHIESNRIDLTSSYEEWRNIGFALADEFGETGRVLFHRLSVFHSEYNHIECDKQYDACLKSNGNGVNLGTLFYLAKNAGVSSNTHYSTHQETQSHIPKHTPVQQVESNPATEQRKELPTLPDVLFSQLPDFLIRIVEVAESNEERDLLLLGSLVTISCTLPSIYGIYHNKKVFANLFLFVSAQASAGKGRLNHCRKLVKPIHDNLKEQSKQSRQQYESDLAEYHANKKKQPDLEKPDEPPLQLLFIPANSSAAGAFQLLNDNQGRGLIFETEGDTLANTFKSDFGNYSDGFRKAFHHETINYYRKTDREYVDLDSPCLSTVLSGTPNQVLNLIPSAEDGLFSRFMFYHMNMQPTWANVFASSTPTGLDDYFYEMGKEYFDFYEALESSPDIQYSLSADQQNNFNAFFQSNFHRYFNLKGDDYIGTIRRLGLITFRLSMILSTFRLMESGEITERLVCGEQDFNSSLLIAQTLFEHAGHIFNQLPVSNIPLVKPNKRERFFEELPESFNRQGYLEAAIDLGIKDKTAQGYITTFVKAGLLHRDEKDSYTKEIQDSKDSRN